MKPITNEKSDKISRDLIDEMAIESEANVLMLINSSEDFIFILDKEGDIININNSVLKALKYSEKELLRMNVLDLHPPEQRNEATSIVRELIKGKRKSLTAPFVTKDNEHIYIEAILTKGKWKNQDVFIGICRDITERKIAEQKLKKSENEFLNLISHMSDVLVEIDENGIIMYISPQSLEIFDYRPEELIGKNFSKFVHPKDLPIIRKRIRKSLDLDSEEAVAFEYRALHKNGHYVTISVKGNKVVSEGKLRYVGVLRDITQQIEAERKLRECEADTKRLEKISQIAPEIRFWKLIQPKKGVSAVQKTRQMLETVIDNIPISMYWKDVDLKYLGCNENYANLTKQKSVNNIIGKTCQDIPVLAGFSDKILKREKQVIDNGVPEYNMVESWKIDGKKEVWFNVNRIPLFDNELNVNGILITVNDISDRIIAEQKISESEKNFRAIAEQSLYGMTIFQDNRIQYVNKQGAKSLEYPQEEMVGWSFKEILKVIHPDDRDYVIEQNQLIIEGSEDAINHSYYRVITKTGKIKYMESTTNMITYQGKPAMLTTTQDITEKKESEIKLKESEEKYRILFDHSPIGIGLSDIYGNVIASNQKMRDITGFSEEELKEINLTNTYVDHSDRKKLKKEIEDSGMIRGFETKLRKKDGSVYTARLNIDLLSLENEDIFLTTCEDITERKAIEQELEKSEREISTLLNNIPDVIITVDQDKKIQFVNHMPTSIAKEEIIGQDIYSFLEHEHQDVLKESFKRVFSTSMPETIDLLAFTNLWYKARFIPIKKGNEVISVILIATNITDTKITSEKLKETEDRLTSILDSSGDLFAIVDNKFKYEYINEEAYIKTLGYSNEELLGKARLDMIHPEDLEQTMNAGLFQKLDQNQFVDYELRIKSKEGNWVNVESRGQSFIDKDGKTKYFLIGRDITFRKQAEQKIKDSEEKYRHLFENSPNAIVLVSLNGVVMDCNPATTELFGYDKGDLINKHFLDIAAYPSELKPQFINSFKNVFQRNYKIPVEFQAFKKDGTLVWVASYLALNRLGQETFVQAIFQDITQKKRSEGIIQKEIERLKEIDQIRNDLVRRISHELKTPLISIYSTSQHLLQNYSEQVDKKVLRLIKTIHKGGKRLKILAENLVNSLRLESRELTLNLQNENLVEVITECIDTFTIFAKERKIFFKKEHPINLMFEIDKIWLSQAITNLISNAIKNTPERGGVLVKLSEGVNNVDITIEDTGVGLTKKEIEKLFEKFGKIERFNEDLDINIEGSGLGLYISKEIVQLHGGEILVDSKGRNQGSSFTIRLYKNKKDS